MSKIKERSSKMELSLSQSVSDSLDMTNSLKKIFKVEENVFGTTPYFLHSGHYGLDYIISGIIDGSGGYPGGKIVEIFGPKSTGKTLLLYYAVTQMQKSGGIVIVADVEQRWQKDFAIQHGVQWDSLIGWSPPTVEDFTVQLMDALATLPDDGKVLVCLDSLASLSTYKEVDDKGVKADQGRKAQRIKAAMRVLPAALARKGATLLVTNHIIDKPGITYGKSYTTPGGQGVPFQATVRIELMSTKDIKLEGKEVPIGTTLRVVCDKNSQTVPFQKTTIDMLWSAGINPFSGLIEMALDLGIIISSGGWYVWNSNKFHGEKELMKAIKANPSELFKSELWKKPYFLTGEV